MKGPTCDSVEGSGWELACTGGGSSGSSALAAAGSTRTAASLPTGVEMLILPAGTLVIAVTKIHCTGRNQHLNLFVVAEKGDNPKKKKLGQEIGKAAAEKSRGLFSADDWQCNKCGNVNWARRQTCNMCNAPRFGEVEERTGYGGGYNDRGVVEYIEREESDDEFDEHLISLRQVLSATETTRSANAAPFWFPPLTPANTTNVLFHPPPFPNFIKPMLLSRASAAS
uniref:RanBP2-type domain-containing protein n=1 Tax=Timema bartmani TaxID=61472 RepID=A0A7R9EWP8_9NEOP|nr:unnamed protein product [Timema bartmani]